jgi:hypothetical protein
VVVQCRASSSKFNYSISYAVQEHCRDLINTQPMHSLSTKPLRLRQSVQWLWHGAAEVLTTSGICKQLLQLCTLLTRKRVKPCHVLARARALGRHNCTETCANTHLNTDQGSCLPAGHQWLYLHFLNSATAVVLGDLGWRNACAVSGPCHRGTQPSKHHGVPRS